MIGECDDPVKDEEEVFELSETEKLALIEIALTTYDDYTDDYSRVERIREIMKQ